MARHCTFSVTDEMRVPCGTEIGQICLIEYLLYQQEYKRKPSLMDALKMPMHIRRAAAAIFQEEFVLKYQMKPPQFVRDAMLFVATTDIVDHRIKKIRYKGDPLRLSSVTMEFESDHRLATITQFSLRSEQEEASA